MPRRRDDRARVLGPTWIPSRQKWRIVVIAPSEGDGGRGQTTRWYHDEDIAIQAAEKLREGMKRLAKITVADAIVQFDSHLCDMGYVEISRRNYMLRLQRFFPQNLPISRITPERARALYETFRRRTRPDGKPISVDYHRGTLGYARSFLGWAVEQGWLDANPLEKVKGIGKLSTGKRQHTGDEITRFYAYCLARAEEGDHSALGILLTFLLALRNSDVTRRLVRDVDMDGTQLIVTKGKTAKSNRPRKIPVVLQPMMRRLVQGRDPFEPLFWATHTEDGHHTGDWLRKAMQRHCEAAGVPYICPHALKGAAGSLLADMGELADRIADHLSHESSTTTRRHYIAPGAIEGAMADRALKVITGGKS